MKFFDYENFSLDLSSDFDKSRDLTRREKKLRRKSWITHDVLNIINAKNKLHKMKVKNPKDKDIANQYRLCQNKLTHIKEELKKSFYQDILSDNMHNSSQIWKTINDIVRYKSKQKHNLQ